MKFLAWLLSLVFAFNLGAGSKTDSARETDAELRNRVQEHIDTIVDESAAIVDEVTESIRQDERVKEVEKKVQDVKDVVTDTAQDVNQVIENTKNQVEEKFGPGAKHGETVAPEATPAVPEAAEPQDQPMPEEPVNG